MAEEGRRVWLRRGRGGGYGCGGGGEGRGKGGEGMAEEGRRVWLRRTQLRWGRRGGIAREGEGGR